MNFKLDIFLPPPGLTPDQVKDWNSQLQVKLMQMSHRFPSFETWVVKEPLGNGQYHLEQPGSTAELRFVKVTGEDPGVFRVGDSVIVGFDQNDRSKPYIISFGGSLDKPSTGVLPAFWSHKDQSGSRGSQTVWTPSPLEKVRSITEFGGSVDNIRVYDTKIYASIFGSEVTKFDFNSQVPGFEFEALWFPVEGMQDFILSEDGSAVFWLGTTKIVRLRTLDLIEDFVGNISNGPFGPSISTLPIPFSLFKFGNQISCIVIGDFAEDIDESPLSNNWKTFPITVPYFNSYNASNGEFGWLVKLETQKEEPFDPKEPYPIVSSGVSETQSEYEDLELIISQWRPTGGMELEPGGGPTTPGYPIYGIEGRITNITTDRFFGPFVHIENRNPTAWSPPVFPGSPVGWGPRKTTLYTYSANNLLELDSADEEGPPDPDSEFVNPQEYAPKHLKVLEGIIELGDDRFVLKAQNMLELACYGSDGGTLRWKVCGWEADKIDGNHVREFYSPLLSTNQNELAVIVRRLIFKDLTIQLGTYSVDIQELVDESILNMAALGALGTVAVELPNYPWIGYHPVYANIRTETLDSIEERRARVCIAAEDFLDLYSNSGGLIGRTPLTDVKVRSVFHAPTGAPVAPPGSYVSALLHDQFVYPYTDPTYWEAAGSPEPRGTNPPLFGTGVQLKSVLDRPPYDVRPSDSGRRDFYSQPWLYTSRIGDPEDMGPQGPLIPLTYLIYQDGKAGFNEKGALWYNVRWEEIETVADAPLLFNKREAILNTDHSIIIFTNGGGGFNFDDDGNGYLPNAVRSFNKGTFENKFLTDFKLNEDYRLLEKFWFVAFYKGGGLAWRHMVSYQIGTGTQVGKPCCGAGKMVFTYRTGGVTKLRVVEDATGLIVEEKELAQDTGINLDAAADTILCGGVQILINQTAVFGIYDIANVLEI